ncbi:unnamed protein product [Caenorhabditis auriculariae]|uniref:Formin-binding protein 1-like n=1 Tax=Caenorhabditis auriculariae TaxID=2777116 RepID=A0A8S1GWT3_9PELO|nr:unnamed protein product [Caenorhabditis auriculariae]
MSVTIKVYKPVTPGSWGDLWDQMENISAHTQKGIEYLERIATFTKERAVVEEEYAARLRGVAKKFFKKKEEEELWRTVSFAKGFTGIVKELESLAGQHEVISESLKKEVVSYAMDKAALHRGTRKQILSEIQSAHAEVNNAVSDMMKAHKQYGKAFKEAEAAFLKYTKAEKNMEISRLDLEKAKNNSQMRNGICEEAKQHYAYAVSKANDLQRWYFEEELPQILEKYKNLDLDRINDVREVLMKCISAEEDVQPIIARCHSDMRVAAKSIDAANDVMLVVENFKSGIPRPSPFSFEDLGRPDALLNGSDNVDATIKKGTLLGRKDAKSGVVRKQSMHQKFFGVGGGSDKKSDNGEYGNLPPQQRARKIAGKLAEIEKDRERAIQSREGVSKMQNAYRSNPKLGNPADCDAQLSQYAQEIDALTVQIGRLRGLLEETNAQLGISESDTPPSVRSYSSASSAAPRSTTPAPATLEPEHHRNSSDNWSRFSEQSAENTLAPNGTAPIANREEVYEECAPPPSLGRATALFAFEGQADGTIRMREGEEFFLVENDEGDGWTRVRRINENQEGFVPSSYLRCEYF